MDKNLFVLADPADKQTARAKMTRPSRLASWRGVAWRGVAWRGVAWGSVAGATLLSGAPISSVMHKLTLDTTLIVWAIVSPILLREGYQF